MTEETISRVAELLGITDEPARALAQDAERLYSGKMAERFTKTKLAERFKRTNPFLLRIRGVATVRQWAENQVNSTLFASEEEAVGHLLEAIVKACYPAAQPPRVTDDLDFEVTTDEGVAGFQVKMSWDCMPMSSRKNLSATVERLTESHASEGTKFVGVFAPCYGKASTTRPKGQSYLSLASSELWTRAGGGNESFDVRVGEVCALLCSEARSKIGQTQIPTLIEQLTREATPLIGNEAGEIVYEKLFSLVNKRVKKLTNFFDDKAIGQLAETQEPEG